MSAHTVHPPGTNQADYEEIQSIFAHRSARQYAAETRRLRTERDSDRPHQTAINRAFEHLNWHARHASAGVSV